MPPKRILIVDDEEGYRKVLSNSLTDMGYETTVVSNALDALKEIQKRKFKVIFLDIKMPGMDGIELLEQIQHAHITTQIVIITAYTFEDVAKEAIKRGARKIIQKPFSMDDIKLCLCEMNEV